MDGERLLLRRDELTADEDAFRNDEKLCLSHRERLGLHLLATNRVAAVLVWVVLPLHVDAEDAFHHEDYVELVPTVVHEEGIVRPVGDVLLHALVVRRRVERVKPDVLPVSVFEVRRVLEQVSVDRIGGVVEWRLDETLDQHTFRAQRCELRVDVVHKSRAAEVEGTLLDDGLALVSLVCRHVGVHREQLDKLAVVVLPAHVDHVGRHSSVPRSRTGVALEDSGRHEDKKDVPNARDGNCRGVDGKQVHRAYLSIHLLWEWAVAVHHLAKKGAHVRVTVHRAQDLHCVAYSPQRVKVSVPCNQLLRLVPTACFDVMVKFVGDRADGVAERRGRETVCLAPRPHGGSHLQLAVLVQRVQVSEFHLLIGSPRSENPMLLSRTQDALPKRNDPLPKRKIPNELVSHRSARRNLVWPCWHRRHAALYRIAHSLRLAGGL